jgi:hypothetical protein
VPFRYRAAARESASNLFVHSADLFVATQPHVDTEHLAYDAVPEKTLLSGGVPGLILPCFWRKREIGKSVLVARFDQIDGYRCLSLMRALGVVKRQLALAWFALRSCELDPGFRTIG